MNRTILALLFTLALTGAAQARGLNHFKASVQAQNNPVLPPVAEETTSADRIAYVSAVNKVDNPGGHVTPLNLVGSKIVSWTHKIEASLNMGILQENCLTTAIYFEARSESPAGATCSGDGYPQPGKYLNLEFHHLRGGLQGRQPLARMPVFFCLRRHSPISSTINEHGRSAREVAALGP